MTEEKSPWIDPPRPRGRCKVTATVIKRDRATYATKWTRANLGYEDRETMVVKDTHGNTIWGKIPNKWNLSAVEVGKTVTFWANFKEGKGGLLYALSISGEKGQNP